MWRFLLFTSYYDLYLLSFPTRRSSDLFVLKTGIAWEHLPKELGCGSGMTCWRRLHEWQQQGVWQQLHETLLARLREADKLDWSRAVVDSSFLPALKGAPKPVRARSTGANRAVSTT